MFAFLFKLNIITELFYFFNLRALFMYVSISLAIIYLCTIITIFMLLSRESCYRRSNSCYL